MITINKEVLKSTNPCIERWKNYLEFYSEFNGSFGEFLDLDKISYADKIWVAKKVLNRNQLVHFAILCAESVLNIYEEKYPNDMRIRDCLSFMKTIVDFSSMTNEQREQLTTLRSGVWEARRVAYASAAEAYDSAYDSAYASAAADADYAAAYASAAVAAVADAAVADAAVADAVAVAVATFAAYTAADAAAFAANAAAFAANAAANAAAFAANAAARINQQNLNLLFLKMTGSL